MHVYAYTKRNEKQERDEMLYIRSYIYVQYIQVSIVYIFYYIISSIQSLRAGMLF